MKLIAVTRIRNDDDIVESFVQHHARIVDQHIFLDNASYGNTIGILTTMKDDGYRISAYRSSTPMFAEATQNTFLLHRASDLGADWVIFLDCDEFVDERYLGTSLRAHLAAVPENALCASATLRNYLPTANDNEAEPIVPLRIRHRDPTPVDLPKVMVRGSLGRQSAIVERGNHSVTLNGQPAPTHDDPRLILAHFPARTGWQMLAKAIVGKLKVVAAGESEEQRGTSVHYAALVEFLRNNPAPLMQDHGYLAGRWSGDWLPGDLVEDPFIYRGGKLRVTPPLDPMKQAVQSLLVYVEELAREHGRMIVTLPSARDFARSRATAFEPLF